MNQISPADIIELIQESKTTMKQTDINPTIPLTEQGLDSLDIFDLFLAIEEKYGIHVEDEQIDQHRTINEIVPFLNTQLSSGNS